VSNVRRPVHVDPADVALVAEPANDLQLRTLITAAQTGDDISVTWVQLDGRHRRLRTHRSTRVYAVLAGRIDLQVADECPVPLSAGQLGVVPRGVPYALAGTATYLVINAPAFVPGDDEYDEPTGNRPGPKP
jgi:mannose-6-phosphate isomerase-like protein (cupin superfamily)